MKLLEWLCLAAFALLLLGIVLWPVLPYVVGWVVLFDWWR